MGLLLK